MATLDDLPIELQEKIMKNKADLEEKAKVRKMKREFCDAMEDFLVSYGYFDQFVEEFMEDVDDEDKKDWQEFLGLEEE